MESKELSESPVRSPRRTMLLVLAVGGVYALTADWGLDQNVDALAAAFPAWRLAVEGGVTLDQFYGLNPWLVEGPLGVVSNRPPGTWLLALPFYLVAGLFTSSFVAWPATATAVVVATAAVVVVYRLLAPLTDEDTALGAALLFAFGTATWPISSAQLWPHGTVQLWLALGMAALASAQWSRAGLTSGLAVLTRPPTAIIAAAQGLYLAVSRRSAGPLLGIGLPAAAGVTLLVGFNRVVHGSWSLSGGYSSGFAENLAGMSLGQWMANVFGMFLDPRNGVLLWSPVLLVLILGLPAAWRKAPDWVRASALAGLLYTVVHARLNRVSGGLPFDYRYQLAMVTLATPLLALSFRAWVSGSRWRLRVFLLLAGVSIVLQGLNAAALQCVPETDTTVVCSFFGW